MAKYSWFPRVSEFPTVDSGSIPGYAVQTCRLRPVPMIDARLARIRGPRVGELVAHGLLAKTRELAVHEVARVDVEVVRDGGRLVGERRVRIPFPLARRAALAAMAQRIVELAVTVLVVELRGDRELPNAAARAAGSAQTRASAPSVRCRPPCR